MIEKRLETTIATSIVYVNVITAVTKTTVITTKFLVKGEDVASCLHFEL